MLSVFPNASVLSVASQLKKEEVSSVFLMSVSFLAIDGATNEYTI